MSNLNKILKNKNLCKSVWFMRQAGRYLPEFRKIRNENKNFVELCLNSEISSEISLQPIKRFDLDSAIIFSDILMVPYALGQEVTFIKNKSPKLSEFNFKKFRNNNEKEFSKKLDPVYKAINITRKKLDIKKSLISFVGAPWTLLIYMLDLKKDNNKINTSKLNKNKLLIDQILNDLTQYLRLHIKNQINAGADVVQIFDSWSGLIPNENLTKFSYSPNSELVKFCKTYNVPSICFPKGLKENYETFNNLVKPDGINLDYEIDPLWAKKKLKDVVIQGGMDPKVLYKSSIKIHREATKYIQAFKDTPYIFNLGHGLLPETDPDKVGKLIKFYRNF
jgi:uroporphyrinogen decarboxylase